MKEKCEEKTTPFIPNRVKQRDMTERYSTEIFSSGEKQKGLIWQEIRSTCSGRFYNSCFGVMTEQIRNNLFVSGVNNSGQVSSCP